MTATEQAILQLIFPENTFEYFDIVSGERDDKLPIREQTASFVFEEKNIPPISDKNKKIISKGFTDITITDFPIRGRKTLLTFRRRYWQVEGQKELLKRDIKLCFPGTQLEKEFALFLKADSGRAAIITGINR
jgi:hypothetical protein